MRLACLAVIVVAAQYAAAQNNPIRTNVPLVVLPTSVTDQHGHPVSGLSGADFEVFDNGVQRSVRVDISDGGLPPVALVVAMQASSFSQPTLAKLEKVGAMIPEAVVGEGGEAAVIAFDDRVRVLQDFTKDPNAIANAFATFKPGSSSGGRMIDAALKALDMLSHRPGARRLNLLLIGESRDRGSESKLTDLLARVQSSRVTIYGLTYSAYWTAFTTKPEDYSPPEMQDAPNVLYTMPLTAIIAEMAREAKKNTIAALVSTTGGRQFTFETKGKLENDLIALGADIHSRYLLSFTPTETAQPEFHKLNITIRNRPDDRVRVRPGYWTGLPASSNR